MPRTVPTLLDDQQFVDIVIRLIDSTGDIRSITFSILDSGSPPIDADFETLVAALAAASNANVFEAQIKYRWVAVPSASAAVDAVHQSVFDNIAINFKDAAANLQQTIYLPAPIGQLIDDSDRVVTTDLLYQNYRNAVDTMLAGGFVPVTARWTERREKNDARPA